MSAGFLPFSQAAITLVSSFVNNNNSDDDDDDNNPVYVTPFAEFRRHCRCFDVLWYPCPLFRHEKAAAVTSPKHLKWTGQKHSYKCPDSAVIKYEKWIADS